VCCWKKQEFGKESLHVFLYCLLVQTDWKDRTRYQDCRIGNYVVFRESYVLL
jgi:hypothetical protein